MELIPLNSKKKKEFYQKLNEYFGLDEKYDLGGILFVNNKNKYYWVDDNFRRIAGKVHQKLAGIYIAEITNYGEIRLSLEGSNVIGPEVTKHIIELDDSEKNDFIRGKDLDFTDRIEKEKLKNQFYILFHVNNETKQKDFLGCGKIKDGELFNFIPKSRRIHD